MNNWPSGILEQDNVPNWDKTYIPVSSGDHLLHAFPTYRKLIFYHGKYIQWNSPPCGQPWNTTSTAMHADMCAVLQVSCVYKTTAKIRILLVLIRTLGEVPRAFHCICLWAIRYLPYMALICGWGSPISFWKYRTQLYIHSLCSQMYGLHKSARAITRNLSK